MLMLALLAINIMVVVGILISRYGAKTIIFAGSFTAKGLEVNTDENKINIIKEGKFVKAKKQVKEITFFYHL